MVEMERTSVCTGSDHPRSRPAVIPAFLLAPSRHSHYPCRRERRTLQVFDSMGVLRLVVLFAVTAVAACYATPAFAHANLVSTSPEDGAVVASAPTEVRVRFDDPVTVGPGNAVVTADRDSVLAGSPRVERGGHDLVLPLESLGNGDYSVRWAIVSDDGHLESGSLAFRVGPPRFGAGVPRSVLEAESGDPSAGNVLARWLFLGGILVAGGIALFRLLVSRAAGRQAATTLLLALIAVVLGGTWLLLTTHGGATRFGHVTGVAVLVAAGGALATAASGIYPRLQAFAMGASLALLAAPTLAGHAFRAASVRPLSVAADLLHVTAAAFWVGGLLQLAVILWTGADPGAARRFSRLALPAVALIALSGVVRALVELTSVSQLWTTGYGRTILVKSALLACLIVLAWLSRHWLGSAMRLLRNVSAELAVLAMVIGAVAVLTALRPGRDASAEAVPPAAAEVAQAPAPPRGSVTFARQSRELAVALAVRPGRPLRLVSTILGQSGRGVDGLSVELAANAGRRASSPARPCGHGCYAASLAVSQPTAFEVEIAGAGRPRSVAFPVAGAWPPRHATPFLRRATRAFRALSFGRLPGTPRFAAGQCDRDDVEACRAEQGRIRDPGRRRRHRHRWDALGPAGARSRVGALGNDTARAALPAVGHPPGERSPSSSDGKPCHALLVGP